MPNKDTITEWFKSLQDDICGQLEDADPTGKFKEDLWSRPEGGGGRTRIFQGNNIEKGGVNFSAVHGPLPEKIATSLNIESCDFYATGISIVLHPSNPHVPIIHMNTRYFEMSNGTWWFGGGIDLTPHYVYPEDSQFFHGYLKEVCDQYQKEYYPKYKQWADDYFYIRHRQETRGIGGIFFDQLKADEANSKEDRFNFVAAVGKAFCPIYLELYHRHCDQDFTSKEKEWQALRRGRYVEFNLVWDRGTKFGLDTNGRTESILMSLPPVANWVYNFQVENGSAEEETLGLLKKGIEWV